MMIHIAQLCERNPFLCIGAFYGIMRWTGGRMDSWMDTCSCILNISFCFACTCMGAKVCSCQFHDYKGVYSSSWNIQHSANKRNKMLNFFCTSHGKNENRNGYREKCRYTCNVVGIFVLNICRKIAFESIFRLVIWKAFDSEVSIDIRSYRSNIGARNFVSNRAPSVCDSVKRTHTATEVWNDTFPINGIPNSPNRIARRTRISNRICECISSELWLANWWGVLRLSNGISKQCLIIVFLAVFR